MSIEQQVLLTLQKLEQPLQGSRVTVGLSGGADSVALCHFLYVHAQALGITVAAAHLNHGLRGAESDADEAFVRQLCAAWQLPLTCSRLNFAPGTHPGEAVLREQRYRFLLQAAGAGYLATGHTLSDSCETLLFRMARGTRLAGMEKIPMQRQNIIRPFGNITREETEAYCAANGLDYVVDSSNLSDAYARNRLRHACLPALQSINPHAQQALGALMEEVAQVNEYLCAEAKSVLAAAACKGGWKAGMLAELPPVLCRQAIVLLMAPYGERSADKVALAQQLLSEGHGAVDWSAAVRLRCENGLAFVEDSTAVPDEEPDDRIFAAEPGVFTFSDGWQVEIQLLKGEKYEKNPKINKKDLKNDLDYDKITDTPVLRRRLPQDRYAVPYRRCTKSLKKWLNEISCPPQLRGRLPLLASGSRVLWLAGYGVVDSLRPDQNTKRVWRLIYRKPAGKDDTSQ